MLPSIAIIEDSLCEKNERMRDKFKMTVSDFEENMEVLDKSERGHAP